MFAISKFSVNNILFGIKNEPIGEFDKVLITNNVTNEYVAVIPSSGGSVTELVLRKDSKIQNIICGCDSYAKLIENKRFRSSKLVPFPNRIAEGKYSFKGVNYQLPINDIENNSSLHGLVFNKPMGLLSKSVNDKSGILRLYFNYKGDVTGYPFSYNLVIEYRFSSEGLSIKTTVKNTGDEEMPFGDGWHPYFMFNEKVDDLSLKIPSSTKVCVDNRLIPTGELRPDIKYTELKRIETDDIDTCYLVHDSETGKVVTSLYSPASDTTISLWQETGTGKYNYLQVYIPPDRQSIAIEPMTCSANAFNNGNGLIVLAPGESFEGSYGVYLS